METNPDSGAGLLDRLVSVSEKLKYARDGHRMLRLLCQAAASPSALPAIDAHAKLFINGVAVPVPLDALGIDADDMAGLVVFAVESKRREIAYLVRKIDGLSSLAASHLSDVEHYEIANDLDRMVDEEEEPEVFDDGQECEVVGFPQDLASGRVPGPPGGEGPR